MPIKSETFNTDIYNLLKTREYDPVPIDSKGETVSVPQEADVFRFTFKKGDKEYGDAWLTIDKGKNLVLYYDDEIEDVDGDSPDVDFPDSFTDLKKHLKYWAKRRQLGFELKNRNHLRGDMAQRHYMKQKEQLGEGYYPMGKKASYNDAIPQVKIILQHTRQIEEGEQRFRNIAKIFVENTNGERFLVPTVRPGIARVYARHVAEGGTPYDEKGKHITSLVEEYTKMAGFVRATRNGQFNESAQRLVNEATNHYQNLRETLSRMTSHRGYNNYFESYTPVLNEESDDNVSLNELFVQETLDPRIESVMPILKRLNKNINEMSEVAELEEWAKSMTEIGLDEAPGAETLAHNQSTEKSNLKAFDLAEEEVEESGLQAYLGKKKYGEKGMKALQKAGKEHASKERMEKIRKKFNKLDEIELEEETKVKYEVRDKSGNRLGTWDGIEFKSYDLTKHKHSSIIPSGGEVDKASGPMSKNDDALVKAGIKEDDLDEGSTVKNFYVKVDGKEKFKTKNSAEANKMAQEMKKDPKFDGKDIEVVSKDDYQVQVGEDLDANQKRAGQLGPTEKVGPKGAVGKLVGASESREFDDIKRLAGLK
jgi:hypothetical protein